MYRILITNAYSARNRGDAAIILGMIESLRRTDILADAEIRVSSVDRAGDAARYPVEVVASFQSLKNGFSSRPNLNWLYFLAVLLPLSLLWAVGWRLARLDLPVPGSLRTLLRTYAVADVVVAAGGGYLYTRSAIHGNAVLLINTLGFVYAVLLGKPVALYAQSVGPFAARWQAWFVRRVLWRVSLVEVREEVSHRLVESWGLPTALRQAADAAFLLDARMPVDTLIDSGPDGVLIVGMTVRRWFRDRRRQQAYERTLARFVDWLVARRGATVVFLPQVTYTEGSDDDRTIARRVAAATTHPDHVRPIEAELSAGEVKWLCGRMDVFVGTRMHSNIFALSSGVPAVAIAYQPKTVGIMAGLGMDEWVLPIDDLGLCQLQRIFDAAFARRAEIRQHLATVMPRITASALDAGRFIAELVPEGTSE
jgi:colanic acid/amylovoran biosynthesis protein